jgi:hypothetical protein
MWTQSEFQPFFGLLRRGGWFWYRPECIINEQNLKKNLSPKALKKNIYISDRPKPEFSTSVETEYSAALPIRNIRFDGSGVFDIIIFDRERANFFLNKCKYIFGISIHA